jgi:hypothetical protein
MQEIKGLSQYLGQARLPQMAWQTSLRKFAC